MEEWNKLSGEERFYSTAENKTKENYISFPVVEGEEPANS